MRDLVEEKNGEREGGNRRERDESPLRFDEEGRKGEDGNGREQYWG